MSKLFSLVRRAPKRFAAAALVLAAVIAIPAMGHAWGPSRDTYTVAHPADHVTFDSITDNPNYGDERNAVTIKSTDNTAAGGWTDDVNVQNGQEYYVRMYVHNNAASNLNLVAHDVTTHFNIPTQSADRIQVDGYLSSSNATPKEIWDQAVFHGSSDFTLAYVPGSATYTNNVFTSGTPLPDTIVSSGAKLGYKSMNGDIPGCFQYSGYVIFKVKASTSDFSIKKTVRVNGASDTTFKDSVTANAGAKVDYQIYFKNTGGTQLKNVVIKDQLPKGVTYVSDSTYLHTSNGTNQISDGITTAGINIGGYLPGGDAYIKFTAQLPNSDALTCGTNTFKNVAQAITAIGSKDSSAVVTVNKDCTPPPTQIKVCDLATKQIVTINESDFDSSKYSKNLDDCKVTPPAPVYTCDLLSNQQVSRAEFKFTAKATAKNGATIKSYSFDFGDGQKVTQDSNVVNHTYAKDGDYTVKVTVNFTVNGKTVSDSGENCSTCITVVPVPPSKIEVCELDTKQIVTINESDFDSSKYSKNLDDCKVTPPAPKQIKVCDLETKKIITINEKDFDSNKQSKNLDDCKSKPVTPPELPHTGISEGILSVLGLGSLAASTLYYLASRRN